MNGLQIDGGFFSPIRQETSDADSSDNSEILSSVSNSYMTVTRSVENKCVSEQEVKSRKETNEFKLNPDEQDSASEKPESSNICTPVSKRNSKTLTSDFNKLKLEKKRDVKDVNVMKREDSSKNAASHQKKQDFQQRKSSAVSNATVSKSEQNMKKRHSSRPSSLLLSKNEVQCSTTKGVKKEKNIGQSTKNIYSVNDIQKSSAKHSEKKLIENSLDSERHTNVKKFEDSCGKSTDSNSKNSYDLSNRLSDYKNQCVGRSKSTSNPAVNFQYEISVERIVNDHISFECDKIRQNIHTQQISFYRELNKVKEEMERQHIATTEHMFKIIEELMQVNFSLKSKPLHNK